MKRLFTILFFLIALRSYAQVPQRVPTWYEYTNYLGANKFLHIPSDTFSVPTNYRDTTLFAAKDSIAFVWSPNKKKWLTLSGGGNNMPTSWGSIPGSIANQTDLIALFNTKQDVLPLGSASQYYRANRSIGTLSTDVLAITDPTYAQKVHTHNPNQIIGLTSFIRGAISVTGSGSYNSETGVINITGGGTGAGLIGNITSNFLLSGDTLKLASVPTTLLTGTFSHSIINDWLPAILGTFSSTLPLIYNNSTGGFSIDTTNISYGLVNRSRLNSAIAANALTFSPSFVKSGNAVSLPGDSAIFTGPKAFVREGSTGYFMPIQKVYNNTHTNGTTLVWQDSIYIDKPLSQIDISNIQGGVPVLDTTTGRFHIAPYNPINTSGLLDGSILSWDDVHKQVVPLVLDYNNDPSLKNVIFDPDANKFYYKNIYQPGAGLQLVEDSAFEIGGILPHAVTLSTTSTNFFQIIAPVDASGAFSVKFSSTTGSSVGAGFSLDDKWGLYYVKSNKGFNFRWLGSSQFNIFSGDSTGTFFLPKYSGGTNNSLMAIGTNGGLVKIGNTSNTGWVMTMTASGPAWAAASGGTSLANGTATNQYLNWNGSAWAAKQIAYAELSGTPTNNNQFTNGAGYITNTLTTALFLYSTGTAPTGSNGGLYYDNSAGAFKGYANGAWKSFLMKGTAIQVTSVNIENNNTANDSLTFHDGQWSMIRPMNSTELQYNSGGSHVFYVGGSKVMTINPGSINLNSSFFGFGQQPADGNVSLTGYVYYNNQTQRFRGNIGGTWKNFLMEGDVTGGTGGTGSYTLPAATTTTLGGVMVPASGNLSVDVSGNISTGANVPLLNAANAFTGAATWTISQTATTNSTAGVVITDFLTAHANNDTLGALYLKPIFNAGSFTNLQTYALKVGGNIIPDANNTLQLGTSTRNFVQANAGTFASASSMILKTGATSTTIAFQINSTTQMTLSGNGNLNLGGAVTDTLNTLFSVRSTTKGSKPFPMMLTAQRDAIATPTEGLMVYNLSTHTVDLYNGSAWSAIGSGASGGDAYLANTQTFSGTNTFSQALKANGGILFNNNGSAWTTKDAVIEGQTVALFFGLSGDGHMASNAYFSSPNWKYKATGPVSKATVYNGTVEFDVAASGTAGTNITWTDALKLSSSSIYSDLLNDGTGIAKMLVSTNGVLSLQAVPSSGSTISGLTAGNIVYATSATTIANSNLYQVNDNGTGDQSLGINISPSGAKLQIDQTGSKAFLKLTRTGTTYAQIASDGSYYSKALDDGTVTPYMVTVTGGVLGKQALPSGSSGATESFIRVTTQNYTVDAANGMVQNIMFESSTTGGTITLPTGSQYNGMALYLTNQETAAKNFNVNVKQNASTWVTSIGSGEYTKLVYSYPLNTWYITFH